MPIAAFLTPWTSLKTQTASLYPSTEVAHLPWRTSWRVAARRPLGKWFFLHPKDKKKLILLREESHSNDLDWEKLGGNLFEVLQVTSSPHYHIVRQEPEATKSLRSGNHFYILLPRHTTLKKGTPLVPSDVSGLPFKCFSSFLGYQASTQTGCKGKGFFFWASFSFTRLAG